MIKKKRGDICKVFQNLEVGKLGISSLVQIFFWVIVILGVGGGGGRGGGVQKIKVLFWPGVMFFQVN